MSSIIKKEKHWFTAADAIILVVVMGLLIGSLVLFLFPQEEKSTAKPVQASIIIHTEEDTDGIRAEDKLFLGETAIGEVQKVDELANNIIILVDLEKDNGVYYLDGKPVRVNGSFTLETRLCKLTGTVSSIGDKEE